MKKAEIIKRTIIFLFAQLEKTDKKALIEAIAENAQLSKADAGRLLNPIPIAELTGIGLISGMNKKELIDAIASHSKLTKSDAG